MCSRANIVSIALLMAIALAVASLIVRYPDLHHGDDFQDADALNAGDNFLRFGFVACRFLPMLERQGDVHQRPYTHYPPLPHIINGILRMAHVDSLRAMRAVALLGSLAGVLCWYVFMRIVTGSCAWAFLAALFYLFNPMFIYGADSLGQFSYSEALRAAILMLTACWGAGKSSAHRKAWAWGAWILCAVQTLVTFEYAVFILLWLVCAHFFLRALLPRISWKYILFLATAPLAGFLLHLLQNIWYFGGVGLACADLFGKAVERISSSQDAAAQSLNFTSWWSEVILRYSAQVSAVPLFLAAVAVVFVYALRAQQGGVFRENTRYLARTTLITYACGLSWYVMFPSHSLAHAYVPFLARHLVPAASCAACLVLFCIWHGAKTSAGRTVARAFALVTAGALLAANILAGELPVSRTQRARIAEFTSFAQCLQRLAAGAGAGDTIGLNYHRFPVISYYTGMRCMKIGDADELARMGSLPRWFLLVPYQQQSAVALAQALTVRYDTRWQCASPRLPFILLERKP
jgi:hypothetical protein